MKPTKAQWARIKLLATDVDGVLTDATVLYGPQGELAKPFFIRDGMGLRLLEGAGVRVAVVTSEDSALVSARVKKLMLSAYRPGQKRKGEAMAALRAEFSVAPEEFAYIGDDVNDLEAFAAVGIAVAPADGHSLLRQKAHFVSAFAGGRGCVREVADLILEAKGIDSGLLWANLHPQSVARDSGSV